MGQFLLDTDICIFFLKEKYNIKQKILSVGIDNIFLSEITIIELTYGAYKSSNIKKHLKEVTLFESLFTVLPIYDNRELFSKEKVRLNQLGMRIPDFDLLIGATAIQHGLTLVTNNEKHMLRLSNVQIDNWAK